MTPRQKDVIVDKLTALTEGPTPLLHSVHLTGDILSVHVQPWGSPVYLNWQQAATFANDLPLESSIPRKGVRSERPQYRKRLHA